MFTYEITMRTAALWTKKSVCSENIQEESFNIKTLANQVDKIIKLLQGEMLLIFNLEEMTY